MKKLLILFILFTLFGCSNSNTKSNNNVESSVELHGYFRAGTLNSVN